MRFLWLLRLFTSRRAFTRVPCGRRQPFDEVMA